MAGIRGNGEEIKSYHAYSLKRVSDNSRSVILKSFKQNLSSAEAKRYIEKEVKIIEGLKHAGIPQVVRHETKSDPFSIHFTDFDGKSLDDRFDGALNLREFFDFASRLLDIVSHAHRHLVFHFAISPENIFISEDWKSVMLVNFNFAQRHPVRADQFMKKYGKEVNPLYISPEQTGRTFIKADSRSDIYSLGLILYLVLTGQSAYPEGQLSRVIHNHLAKTPDTPHRINDAIPRVLSDMIMKMIAKDVKARYQSISGLMRDVERAADEWERNAKVATFKPGQEDVKYEFEMPEVLEGREEELKRLRPSSIEEVQNGKIVLIEGAEGVGKSHLIRAYSRRHCQFDHEYFEVRCDSNDSTSFSPFLKMLNSIYTLAAKRSKSEQNQISKSLEATLGPGDGWVLDLIPALSPFVSDIFDKRGGRQEQNRTELQLLINWLFAAVSRSEKPLFLLFDEFQNSDGESLQFVKEMALIERVPNAYFVFTINKKDFQDYASYLESLLSGGTPGISELMLDPLGFSSFQKVIFSIIRHDIEEAGELADYLFKVTNGNLRYLSDFLRKAIDNNSFVFNPELNIWTFDIDKIKSIEIPEDRLDFVMEKINGLEGDASKLLSFITIYGEQFNEKTLEKHFEGVEGHTIYLRQIEEAGLIQPVRMKSTATALAERSDVREASYDFVHIRLKQRLYQTIPKSSRSQLHKQIGTSMLEATGPGFLGKAAIEIANHFIHVDPQVWEPNEKKKVQSVMLEAASQAKVSTSFELALEYLQLGLKLGTELMTRTVRFKYHELAGESAYLSGQYALAENYLDQAFTEAVSNLEKAKILQSQLIMCNLKGELDRVMRLGIKALNLLGVKVNYKSTSLTIVGQIIRIAWKHRRMKKEDFLNLPRMTDPKALLAHEILLQVLSWSFSQSPELLGVMVLKIHRLTLEHGNSVISYAGYGGYGAVLSEGFGKDVVGVSYVKLGQEVCYLFKDSLYKFRGIASGGGTVVHRALPWKDTIGDLMTGLEKARELGDITNYGSLSFLLFDQLVFHGKSLNHLVERSREFLNYARVKRYEDMEIFHHARHLQLAYLNSDGEDDNLVFDHDLQLKIDKTLYGYVRSSTHIFNLFMAILESRVDDIMDGLEVCEELKSNNTITVLEVQYAVLRAVGSVIVIDAFPERAKKCKKWIRKDLKLIGRFCKHVPEDYTCFKVVLQAAEMASIDKLESAAALLERNYPKPEGNLFANLLKSQLHLSILNQLGRDTGDVINELWKVNSEWGSKRLDKILRSTYGTPMTTESSKKEVATDFNEYLDIETVLKANAVLTEDINLESLVKNLLGILVEHAGASHGKLLLNEENNLVVASVFGEEVESIDPEVMYPEGIVRQTIESLEPVIIHNLHERVEKHREHYFSEILPPSVLSVPILNRGKLVGVVYLENRVTPNVFTRERLNLIRAISAQAAMSLENSRQYSRMLKLNDAYEKFVPREFLRYLDKKSILDIRLGDQVKRSMTIMFSDMRDFTSLSERLTTKENFDFINDYLLEMEPLIRQHGGFIDKYIGDSIMALFPSSPLDAVACAVEMNETLMVNNKKKDRSLEVGYGINTGELMLGIIGGRDRMEGTVISDTVNIAARIESLTKHYGTPILISDATCEGLGSDHGLNLRKIDNVIAKGKTQPVGLYEVLVGLDDNEVNGWLRAYNNALSDFGKGDWVAARKNLEEALEQRPEDRIITTYLRTCDNFIADGVEDAGDHISVFEINGK